MSIHNYQLKKCTFDSLINTRSKCTCGSFSKMSKTNWNILNKIIGTFLMNDYSLSFDNFSQQQLFWFKKKPIYKLVIHKSQVNNKQKALQRSCEKVQKEFFVLRLRIPFDWTTERNCKAEKFWEKFIRTRGAGIAIKFSHLISKPTWKMHSLSILYL